MLMARSSTAVATAVLLAGAALTGVATAQPSTTAYVGRVYEFHAPGKGGCPAQDWHIVVGPNDTLSGMISTNDMARVFKVTGKIQPNNRFHLDGKEVGGNASGSIDGQVTSDGKLTAMIEPMNPNSPCKGVSITVPFYQPGALQGGGG